MGKKSKSRKSNNKTLSIKVQWAIIAILIALVGYVMNMAGCEGVKHHKNKNSRKRAVFISNLSRVSLVLNYICLILR